MTFTQELMLYFGIIPTVLFLVLIIFKSLVEEDIKFRTDVNKLRKNNRKLAEEWEKQEFLFKLYHKLI